MGIYRPPFIPAKNGAVVVGLRKDEREAIRGLAADYRELLRGESQASDPAVARLFPPAYREDPLRNFDFERQAHDALMTERLGAIDSVAGRTDAERLSSEDARVWLGVLNDLRLVIGTRIGVSEDTQETSFSEDPAAAQAFGLYRWLTHLVGTLLEAIDPGLADFQGLPGQDVQL